MILSASLSPMIAGSGEVVNVLFMVAGSVAVGASTPLKLALVLASDTTGAAVAVTGILGSVIIGDEGNSPTEGQDQLIFPQVASGVFESGSFVVTLIFVNRTLAESNGRVRLFQSDETPFPVTLTDRSVGSSFDFTVPVGGSMCLRTAGSGPLSAGYALLDSTAPLRGAVLFTKLDEAGPVTSEAGVRAYAVQTHSSIPVLFAEGGTNTGVAFVNFSSETVEITLQQNLLGLVHRDTDTATLSYLCSGVLSEAHALEG